MTRTNLVSSLLGILVIGLASGQEIIEAHKWVKCPDDLKTSPTACIQVSLNGRDTVIPLNLDRNVGSNHLGLKGASDDGEIVVDVLADRLFERPALTVRNLSGRNASSNSSVITTPSCPITPIPIYVTPSCRPTTPVPAFTTPVCPTTAAPTTKATNQTTKTMMATNKTTKATMAAKNTTKAMMAAKNTTKAMKATNKTTPAPTRPAQGTTTVCKDATSQCKEVPLSQCQPLLQWCPRHCGVCGPPTTTLGKAKNTTKAMMAAKNTTKAIMTTIKTTPAPMRPTQGTTTVCEDKSHICSLPQALVEHCKFAPQGCAKSCGICGPPTTTPCQDLGHHCPFYGPGKIRRCGDFYSIKNCKLQCGYCTVGGTTKKHPCKDYGHTCWLFPDCQNTGKSNCRVTCGYC